jgi:sigma-B regulation protein RsbU (phosphoserine phosphatase)
MTTPVRWPILAKLSFLAITVSIIPIAVVAYIGASRGLRAVEATALRNIELIADGTAQRLDQLVADAHNTVNVIASDEDVVALCTAGDDTLELFRVSVIRRLGLIVNSNPDFASAFVTNADGIGLASTNPSNIGQDLTFRDYWNAARAGNAYVSDILIGKTTGEPGVYFARPVRDEDAEIVGVAVLKFDAEAIWRITDSVRTGDTGFASIVDEHGVILAAPNRDNIFKSLGPLSPEQIAAIDPDLRWGRPTIEHLNLPELMSPLLAPEAPGSMEVDRRDVIDPFIVGFAPMTLMPWTVGVVETRSEFDAPIRKLRQQQLLTVAGVAGLAAIFALIQSRNLARPIRDLDEAAQRLAEGDFDARVTVTSHDEIARLGRTFNAMAPRLAEQVKMSEALNLAREVQRNLLPHGPPSIEGFDIAGRSIPADQTGGDYYDFIDMTEHRQRTVGLVIGDVTGHGVAAALLMATARAVLRSGASPFDDLSRLASMVNVRLALDTDHGRFMTLFYMVLDGVERKARWISAGHDPAVVFVNGQFHEFAGEDIPLGIERDWIFTEQLKGDVEPGTLIVIGTDGIWEARNADGQMYAKDRMREVIRDNADKSSEGVVNAVISSVKAFSTGHPQQDDITVVAVRVLD